MCYKKFIISITFSIILLILLSGYIISSSACLSTDPKNIIQTYGEAELTAQPDLTRVSMSIETRNISAKEAVIENSKLTNIVFNTLLHFGLPESTIQTGSYRLYSYQEWQEKNTDSKQENIYYQATNEIIVSFSQLDNIGEIIDLAVQSGVNKINYINFELKNPQELILQALRMATEQARLKAESIAEGAGKTISEVISIREEKSTYTPFRLQENMLQRQFALDSAPTPIRPSEVTVSVTVVSEFSFY